MSPCQYSDKMRTVLEASARGSIKDIDALADRGYMNHPKTRAEALMEACSQGHLDLVQRLVQKHGCNLRTHLDGPLYGAIAGGRIEVVRYIFLELKGQRPLVNPIVCACCHSQLEILRYYLAVNPDSLGQTAYAALESATYQECLPILVFLIEEKGLLGILRLRASEFLSIACRTGNVEIFRYFVESCKLNPIGHPSLVEDATASGSLDLIAYMVEICGFDLQYQRESMAMASLRGNAEIVKYFIHHNICKESFKCAYINAAFGGHLNVIKVIPTKEIDVQSVEMAMRDAFTHRRWNVYVYLRFTFPEVNPLGGTNGVENDSYESFMRMLIQFLRGRFEPPKMKGLCSDYLFDGNIGMIVMSYT